MATRRAGKELDSIKATNQALLHDVLALRDEMEHLKRGSKRGVEAVTEKTPPAEPARGKSRQEKSCQTPVEWAKMADAYRRLRDEKDMAEREVSVLEEQINRIKILSPSSSKKKKLFVRRRSSKEGISPTKKTADQVKVTFVRKIGEEKEVFNKRVSCDLAKLRKAQLETLCADKAIEYAGVKKTAGDLADIYTARAYGQPVNRCLASDNEDDEQNDEGDDDSTDVPATSTEVPAASETS
ncbi:hypothetical protein CBR_g3635 [Chara braunii]|uniref:Uncharacterized protein n=1 Tax=Chara braunii TaxID=69332 RepID=A0A388KFY5_CHABU|nr:hypothetical protein CBR_g3635 [Chara braunii]|eukprot:GBG68936.1 hypothetical protein CBR_g3635 [Chara braunii]